MTTMRYPFAVPAKLPKSFRRVREYWENLKRGDNDIPFWDDVNLSLLPDLSADLMLIDAFENPQRFRLNALGANIRERYGSNVTGKFVDEIAIKPPFEFFTAQASVTVEASAPTYFGPELRVAGSKNGDERLLLPLWGNGRIEMILGLIA